MAKRTSRKAAPPPLLLSRVPTGFILTRSTTIPSGRTYAVQARKAAKHRNRQEA